ncbi:hypothetical protein TPR58_17385 [Sphingomonas sp. HF-S3]|uniref:Uncharacterized protein n=1 Tax=Sphingomonas rustica TaxID=3103142 RepID=A0ABV0BBL6_9SPHN
MKISIKRAAPVALALVLAACDGGGSGGGVQPAPTPTPTPITTLNVTLSKSSGETSFADDEKVPPFEFDAAVVGATADPVIADLQYDRTRFTLDSDLARGADGKYRVRLIPIATLASGAYAGTVTFRLCRDAACSIVYPGSTQSFSYRFTARLADWTTFQRNAAHNGYVRSTFDPAVFRKAWDYKPANVTYMSTVSSANGLIYVGTGNADGTSSVRALAAANADERWAYNMGVKYSWSGPAIGKGKVLLTSMVSSSDSNQIVSVDAVTGQYSGPNMRFASQWSNFLPPTPYGDELYMSAGYYGNVLYGFSLLGESWWSSMAGGGQIWDGQTPAVDADNVYYYSGPGVDVYDRITHRLQRRLVNPFFDTIGYSYYGSPILGMNRNVLVYSGHRRSETPSILVNWLIDTRTHTWRSVDAYSTTPGVGGGSVYLARNAPSRLDALDEVTGAVRWSWTPPASERFVGNTIVTATLVFVSTDKAIYAIPLQGTSHAPAWSAPSSGEMALTADGLLVVTHQEGGYTPRSLVAYRLQ